LATAIYLQAIDVATQLQPLCDGKNTRSTHTHEEPPSAKIWRPFARTDAAVHGHSRRTLPIAAVEARSSAFIYTRLPSPNAFAPNTAADSHFIGHDADFRRAAVADCTGRESLMYLGVVGIIPTI